MQYTQKETYCIKINTAWAFFQSVKKSDEKLFQSLVKVAEQCESEYNDIMVRAFAQCEGEFNAQNFDITARASATVKKSDEKRESEFNARDLDITHYGMGQEVG